jgi:hypothetical protein
VFDFDGLPAKKPASHCPTPVELAGAGRSPFFNPSDHNPKERKLMTDNRNRRRPEYTTWLAMRPHVLGAIAAAAKVIAAKGKTPTTEAIIELLSGCYSREVIEIACEELKRVGRLLC